MLTYFGIDGWRERARSRRGDCGSPNIIGGSGSEVCEGEGCSGGIGRDLRVEVGGVVQNSNLKQEIIIINYTSSILKLICVVN